MRCDAHVGQLLRAGLRQHELPSQLSDGGLDMATSGAEQIEAAGTAAAADIMVRKAWQYVYPARKVDWVPRGSATMLTRMLQHMARTAMPTDTLQNAWLWPAARPSTQMGLHCASALYKKTLSKKLNRKLEEGQADSNKGRPDDVLS